jgi:hypothetical protein
MEMRIDQTRKQTPSTEIDSLGDLTRGTTLVDRDDAIAVNGDEVAGPQIASLQINQRSVLNNQHTFLPHPIHDINAAAT